VSRRRACKVVLQARSTQRYNGSKCSNDAALRAALWRICLRRSPLRFSRATAIWLPDGDGVPEASWYGVNAKRVQRLWRLEGLKVSVWQRKRARHGNRENGT
jgi:hypothetical protein